MVKRRDTLRKLVLSQLFAREEYKLDINSLD